MDHRQLPPTSKKISRSALTTLPSELLIQIFSLLRPDPERFPTNGSYRELLALSATGHHNTYAIAVRTLYDTVVVQSARAMTQLLVALIRYPERRRWIRTFCCLESLSGRRNYRFSGPKDIQPLPPMVELYLKAGGGESTNCKLAALLDALRVRELDDDETSEFRQRVYYALLCHMPRLQDLKFPSDIPEITPGDRTNSQIERIRSLGMENPAPHSILASLLKSSTAEPDNHNEHLPCPAIRSLTFLSAEGFWSSYQAIPFIHFPRLKTITLQLQGFLWNPHLLWSNQRIQPGLRPASPDDVNLFADVKHLRLFPNTLSPGFFLSLAHVVKKATQLETLEIGAALPGHASVLYNSERSMNLNKGILRAHAPTLQRLAIYQKWATHSDSLMLFGHRQKLLRLHQLTRLEELVAPSFAIFGALFMEKREPSSWLQDCDPLFLPMPVSCNRRDPKAPENVPEYADPTNSGNPKNPDKLVLVARRTRLPPALRVLEIYEDPCSDFRWTDISWLRGSSREDIVTERSSGKLFKFMKEFAFDFRNRFPKMERVVFWAHDWQGFTPQWTNGEVQEVKDAFRVHGVKFIHKECPQRLFGQPIRQLRTGVDVPIRRPMF